MSQAETKARHAREKKARVRANREAAAAKDLAVRRANGAIEANAKAGSKARAAVNERRAARASALTEKRAQRHQDAQDRAQAARDRQKAIDEKERTNGVKDEKAEAEANKKAQEAASEKKDPKDKQQPKKKGTLQGKVVGAIDKGALDAIKAEWLRMWTRLGEIAEDTEHDAIAAGYVEMYSFLNTISAWNDPGVAKFGTPWIKIFKKGSFSDDQ